MKTENLFIHFILLIFLLVNCNPPRKTLEEKLTQGGSEAAAFWVFIFPTLDFNQFCPPTDQIPILEPGNHSIFLSEGQSYFFDNRARLDGFTSISDGDSKEFTFIFQENPGQDVTLETPRCGQNENAISSRNNSGLKGQLESVKISLANPFRSGRSRNFVRITSTIGSGTILLTSPSKPNPSN
ncbi:MAG: LIC_10705 family lipoprotein [Leptospiraceae bacterium]|nr:LIC_10705 family lipoprotein [Leptospiraceae bacterium]